MTESEDAPESEPVVRKWRDRQIKFSYGTAVASLILIVSMLAMVVIVVVTTFQRVSELEQQNSCRAQYAEDERRATLDVVTGLGDTFVIAVENREQVASYIAAYRGRVNDANSLLKRDIEKACA